MEKKKKSSVSKKLEECEKEKEEYLYGWKKAKADLINYKKEEASRAESLLKEKKRGIILRVVSVMDSFDRAVEEAESKEDSFYEGFLNIKKQMEDVLKKEGVEAISSLGEEFDPSFHEVVEMIEKEGVESGTVVEEVQKGYKMDGELIRPSKVKVAL